MRLFVNSLILNREEKIRRLVQANSDECADRVTNGRNRLSINSKDLGHVTWFPRVLRTLQYIPYAVFALILFTVIVIPIVSEFLIDKMARCHRLPDRRAIFFTLFEDRIRREFHSQSAETMSTIASAVSHILRPYPERPSILLCLASPGGKDTCAKLSRATATVVMSSFQKPSYDVDKVTLDCSDYTSSQDFWTFYEDMAARMSRDKVVVLTGFEKINPQVACAFYHLADDAYAPFPQSIVIVCLDIGNRFDANYLRRQAPVNVAESFLEERWYEYLDRTAITEILGRITGRTVLIDGEVKLRRLTSSLPSINGYSGAPPKLRRRRRTARSDVEI